MNIILGQYYPAGSVIEKIDARVKLIATIIYIIAVFMCNRMLTYGICTLFLILIAMLSRLPIKMLLSGLKSMLFIVLFTIVVNIFFNHEGKEVLSLGFIKITDMGILKTAEMTLRLLLLVMFSSMLTLTTKPVQLTVAIEKLLKPFSRLGLPSHEIAMMMGIALRFIPTLMEELDKIKKAQSARGVSFDEGGFFSRIKSLIPVIIPLFVSSFRRADELAIAMEARCYRGGTGRTRLNNPKLCLRDIYALLIVVVLLFVVILLEKLL